MEDGLELFVEGHGVLVSVELEISHFWYVSHLV